VARAVPRTLEELRSQVSVNENRCWGWLKEDGQPTGPKTVPVVGPKPGVQVAVLAVKLSGRDVPTGHVLRRMPGCLRFCCNPDHLTVQADRVGTGTGRVPGNPKGNASSLRPDGGRAPGTPRPWRQGRALGGRRKEWLGLPLDKDRRSA
jgi:hypothetical protein